MLDVAVVTVNYKMRDKVVVMLRSLVRDLAGGSLRVQLIVVDNASGDGVAEVINHEFRNDSFRPIVIAAPKNVGFGRGNNIAIRRFEARYYFMANSDLLFLPEQLQAIERLYKFMERRLDIGIVAPRLELPDGNTQPSCMRFPGLFDQPLYRLGFHQRYPWAKRSVEHLHMSDFDHTRTQPIDWATGAALFIRGSWLREIGGFDERYFMYFEDCDLCRTFWSRGWPVYYKGDVMIRHGHERASAKIPGLRAVVANPLTRVHLASWIRYTWKWRGKRI
ncbi:MAG: glycosyltransferase family 2 protein [Candidatus Uhrbacteria bacterium]